MNSKDTSLPKSMELTSKMTKLPLLHLVKMKSASCLGLISQLRRKSDNGNQDSVTSTNDEQNRCTYQEYYVKCREDHSSRNIQLSQGRAQLEVLPLAGEVTRLATGMKTAQGWNKNPQTAAYKNRHIVTIVRCWTIEVKLIE